MSTSQLLTLYLSFLFLALLPSCKEQQSLPTENSSLNKEISASKKELLSPLSHAPTEFLRLLENQELHYHLWEPALFEHARNENKPVIVFLYNSLISKSFHTIKKLNENPEFCSLLNKNTITCAVDIQAYPEVFQYYSIVSEINKTPKNTPACLFLSPEGDTFSLYSYPEGPDKDFVQRLYYHTLSSLELWKDSSEYISKDAKRTEAHRRALFPSIIDIPLSSDLSIEELSHQHFDRLLSLYDHSLKNWDYHSGIYPSKHLQFLVNYAKTNHLTETQKDQLIALFDTVIHDSLSSSIFDPLEGGLFCLTAYRTWEIGSFVDITHITALTATTLIEIGAFIESESATKKGHELLELCWQRIQQGIAATTSKEDDPTQNHYFWKLNDLKQILAEEEYLALKKHSGLKKIGNISYEADPLRNLIGFNSLRNNNSSPSATLQAAFEKLRTVRQQRQKEDQTLFISKDFATDSLASVAEQFFSAALLSQNPAYLEKGLHILEQALSEERTSSETLLRFPASHSSVPARARDYALVIRNLIKAYELTLSSEYLKAAQKQVLDANQLLATNGEMWADAPKDEANILGVQTYSMYVSAETTAFAEVAVPLLKCGRILKLENLLQQGKLFRQKRIPLHLKHPNATFDLLDDPLIQGKSPLIWIDPELAQDSKNYLQLIKTIPNHRVMIASQTDYTGDEPLPGSPFCLDLEGEIEGFESIESLLTALK